MTDTTGTSSWTWRDRVRDPRFYGVLALALGVAIGLAVAVRGSVDLRISGALVVVLVAGLAGAMALPRWRDESHSAKAGASMLPCGARASLIDHQLQSAHLQISGLVCPAMQHERMFR
jgi:hypothetical protein